MRIHVIVETEDGMPIAETSRELVEGVHFNGKFASKVIMHPKEDLMYEVLNKAEDNINHWDDGGDFSGASDELGYANDR